MNTEEKAKAYDEALNRAKKELQTCGSTDCDAARQIFRFFPTLRESEGERIIVRLIEYFQGFLEGYEDCYKDGGCVKWEGLDVKSILAWLEKQKEQKHPNGCFTCDEYKKGYEEGRRNGFTAGYNKAMKEAEQKEQKPVVTLGETYHVDTLGTQQVIAGKMPQNPPERSLEDDHIIGFVYDLLNEIEWKDDWAMSKDECLRLLSNYIPQKSAEWSEEDDWKRKELIQYLEEKGDYRTVWMTWLKSLRPQSKDEIYKEKDNAFKLGKHQLAIQFMNYLDYNRPKSKVISNGEYADIDKAFKENNWKKIMGYADKYLPYVPSWKPSEAQLMALHSVIDDESDTIGNEQLKLLYEQLKKLL